MSTLLTPSQIAEIEQRTPDEIRRERDAVLKALECVIGSVETMPAWFGDEWSRTWQLQGEDGTRWFLKMTPRRRREADLLLHLHALAPRVIPRVVAGDVQPHGAHRWFLMENCGAVSGDFEIETACEASQALGVLQRQCATHLELSLLTPQCGPLSLHECVLEAVSDLHTQNTVRAQCENLIKRRAFWNALSVALLEMPPTLVHGDFWMGNVARRGDEFCFLDWGDALWGIGGISIANLLAQHDVKADDALRIWRAFETGWQKEISEEYRRACVISLDVASLMIRSEIRECCESPSDDSAIVVASLERLNTAVL
jgi:hypothetical protein